MSINEEKKFVLKHTFTDVDRLENGADHFGEKLNHFNIPWSMFICSRDFTSSLIMHLECFEFKREDEWSIDTTIVTKVFTKDGQTTFEIKRLFSHKEGESVQYLSTLDPLEDFLVCKNLTVECHVTIHKVTGIKFPFDNYFDTDSAKEFSDIVLKVKDRKFHVYKMYLSFHSTYFKSLFLGNFDESKQSEVELKDIEPEDFQNFLKVIYAMPDINDKTVDGILHLADMYDANAAMQQCEKFLIDNSKLKLKEKFLLAIQYKLENLKRKCMPKFKSPEDIAAVIPADSTQFDTEVWKDLLNLALTFARH